VDLCFLLTRYDCCSHLDIDSITVYSLKTIKEITLYQQQKGDLVYRGSEGNVIHSDSGRMRAIVGSRRRGADVSDKEGQVWSGLTIAIIRNSYNVAYNIILASS
jgi:hypothetical protein